MIVGLLSEVDAQASVLPAAIVRGLGALRTMDLVNMAPGRYALDGDSLFVLVQDMTLRTMAESRPEAHRQYADIQIPLGGSERYGFALPQPALQPTEDSLAEKDVAFYPTPAGESLIDVAPGEYIVFLPHELHRPGLIVNAPGTIRKAVVKVHRSLLGV